MSSGETPGRSSALAFFEREAAAYDAQYESAGPRGYALRARAASVLSLVGAGPGRALDAGMGSGRLVAGLERAGWTAWGIDLSPAMVAIARARAGSAGARLQVAPIERLPFPAGRFDVVVATGVLEHADDLGRAMGELARVLRPDGRAVVSIPNRRSPYSLWRAGVVDPALALARQVLPVTARPLRHRRAIALSELRRLAEGVGLAVVTVEHTVFLVVPVPLERLAPRLSVALAVATADRGPRFLATQRVILLRRSNP